MMQNCQNQNVPRHFREVDVEDVKMDRPGTGLLDVLKRLLPETAQMLNIIKIKREGMYVAKDPRDFKFFSLETGNDASCDDRDWSDPSVPLFLVAIFNTKNLVEDEIDFTFKTLYSREPLSSEDGDLVSMFSKLFDWNKKCHIWFPTLNIKLIPFVEKVAENNGRIAKANPKTVTLLLPLEEGKDNLHVSSAMEKAEIFFSKLEECEAVTATREYRYEGYGPLFVNQIQKSICVGAYLSPRGIGKELVAWTFFLPNGLISALQTKDAHRRKKIGENLLIYEALELAKNNLYPVSEVADYNPISAKLHEKIGFQLVFESAWIECIKVEQPTKN